MIKLQDILSEQLKQSHITLLKRLYSAYASNRNSKTTLKKLYKLQTKLPYAEVFKSQKISPPPYYRAMKLDNLPEVGDTFNFGLAGWTTNESVAKRFLMGKFDRNGIIFETLSKEHAFLDLKEFGLSIKEYIEINYPNWEDDYELSKLHLYAKPSYNESEVVLEPHVATVESVVKKERFSDNPIYYVEVT